MYRSVWAYDTQGIGTYLNFYGRQTQLSIIIACVGVVPKDLYYVSLRIPDCTPKRNLRFRVGGKSEATKFVSSDRMPINP